MLYIQGRIYAATYDEAVQRVRAVLDDLGYAPAGEIRPWACLGQPWRETLWWEYLVKIEKKGDLRWRILNILRKLKNWRAK